MSLIKTVYLTGASGTGKSELAADIATKFSFEQVSASQNDRLRDNGWTWDDITAGGKEADVFQDSTWEAHRELDARVRTSTSKYVLDRCLLDVMAYSACHSSGVWRYARSAELEEFIKYLKTSEAAVLFCRPHVGTFRANDGRRDPFLTPEYVYRIDGIVQYLLESNEVPHIALDSPLKRNRWRTVCKVLR